MLKSILAIVYYMNTPIVTALIVAANAVFFMGITQSCVGQSPGDWAVHDRDRPQPPVVTPPSTYDQAGAPSDAVVLFDGTDLSHWHTNGQPARWNVENGSMQINIRSGSITSHEAFSDCQLHIEWASPVPAQGEDQRRGNSGVFLMGLYEVQVLDSYQSITYPDGQASAIYGQYPPLVNASRPPGEWQTYDIVFIRPRFDDQEELISPARITVFHNGILVHDNVELTGPTAHTRRPPYAYHEDKLPISLQDHGDSEVRYRNIWVRELE